MNFSDLYNYTYTTGSGTCTGDTVTYPTATQPPYIFQPQQLEPKADWEKYTFTITNTKEGVVVKQAKSYLVIQRGSGTVAACEETEGDALSAAARLAAKTGEEYFVFRPGKVVRQKPVDIETVDP